MLTLPPILQPYKPSSDEPWNAERAAHLLNRAGFGGTPEEVDRLVKMGPEAALDSLMDFPNAGADEETTSLPDLSGIQDYPPDFRELGKMFAGKTDEEKKALRMKLQQANRDAIFATVYWWMNRMSYGEYPLHEKLVLFWHGHFTTSDKDERAAILMWRQNELLRRYAAGNFHEFVKKISRDPAMLDYLNNNQNRKAHPNENYARELMELFTLGIGNYTEDDVKEGAFTGWGHDGLDFVYRRNDHDTGSKTFLGHTGNFDGDDIIDIIFSQPACPKFIASELYKYFVAEEIDDTVATALGQYFRENNFELRPLLRTILASKAFYDFDSVGSQIKCPIQLVVGTTRLMDLEMPNRFPGRLYGPLNQMGQVPFAPPNVKGWPGGRMWINTSTMFVRYNTGIDMVSGSIKFNKTTNSLVELTMRGMGDNKNPGPDQVVDYWIARLIQRPIDPAQRQVLLDAVGTRPDREDSLRRLVQLIVSMPEYQLC